MRKWAHARDLLAIPDERSSHLVATPTGGGLVIAFITMAGVTSVMLLHQAWIMPGLVAYLVAVLLIASVGWLDDLYTLPATLRFGVQAAAAVAIMLSVDVIQYIVLPGDILLSLGWFGYPLTFLWIVGLTNAYNFMDGIDGNAGGIGAVAGWMWTLVALQIGEPILAFLGGFLSVSCLGFLKHNWQPARIFMGDVGSTFLGFTFSVLPLLALQSSGDERFPLVGALIVAPCIWDAAYTFIGRIVRQEPVFEAHRTYLYQRLATLGYPHWAGACFYTALTLALGMCGLLYLSDSEILGWEIIGVASTLLVLQVAVVQISERWSYR